jgi:glycosyltransferase involved in cell wall biosynthesis
MAMLTWRSPTEVVAEIDRPLKVVMVTNIPSPYRLPLYARMAVEPGLDFTVIFCSALEPDRNWQLDLAGFDYRILRKSFVEHKGYYIHNNLDIVANLQHMSPDVVITTGFNPTFIYAYMWTQLRARAHIAMTDGTPDSEAKLTGFHRLARRWLYSGTQAYVGASRGSAMLYRNYRISAHDFFQSLLCVDNRHFHLEGVEKQYDLLFSGRMVSHKRPEFALQVAERAAGLLGRPLKLLMMGSGELQESLKLLAAGLQNVTVNFPGFLQQDELPVWFNRCRLMIFPTSQDPWGIVANEACAAGLPVVISPHAGAAGEIVLDGLNGYVRELEIGPWAQAVCKLLSNETLYQSFSRASRDIVESYNYDVAARGLIDACHFAAMRKFPGKAFARAS